MTAKEYLNQVNEANKKIETDLLESERLRSLAERTTTSFNQAPASGAPAGNKVEDGALQLLELAERITEELENLMRCQAAVRACIEEVKDIRAREVLARRYLCGEEWEEIMRGMHYAETTVHRYHRAGLAEIENMAVNGS